MDRPKDSLGQYNVDGEDYADSVENVKDEGERIGAFTYPAFSKISAARTTLLFAGRKAHTILIVVVTARTIQKSKKRSERMNLWPRFELML